MKPLKNSESELRKKAAELKRREAALNEKEARLENEETGKPRMRDNLYARITIPVKVLDIIIWGVVILLVLAVAIGIIMGNRAPDLQEAQSVASLF